MEVKFIWIKHFGMIQELGVNFNHSDLHRFEYKEDKLLLLPNKYSPLKFGRKITGLTAIAGQNGSGKTTLCQALLSTTATLTSHAMGVNQIFDGIVCFGAYIFYHKDLLLANGEELVRSGYILKKFNESPLEGMMGEEGSAFHKNGFIYFSLLFDPWNHFSEFNLKNISTVALMLDDYKKSSYYRIFQVDGSILDDREHLRLSDIAIFGHAESNRMVNFAINEPDFLPFRAALGFVIKSSFSYNNRWFSRWEELRTSDHYTHPLFHIERDIFSIVFDDTQEGSQDANFPVRMEDFKRAIRCLYRYNVVRVLFGYTDVLPDFDDVYSFVFEDGSTRKLWPNFDDIDKLLVLHDKIASYSVVPAGDFSPSYLQSDHKGYRNDWRFYLIERLFLSNTPDAVAALKAFINLEKQLLGGLGSGNVRISNFSISSSLSSGQYSFLSFFSRLYDVIQNIDADQERREKIVLFIDEADVGYHPAWSKCLLTWILKFIDNFTPGYQFQIIMTTHSPYLLSDLAPQNVLLLKRSTEDTTEIAPSDSFETFGANIYELLANSFFLSDGSIGEFAKDTINRAIAKLNYWSGRQRPLDAEEMVKFDNDKIELKEIISIIADNMVRGKLVDMYDEVFGESNALEREIQRAEERVQLLKNKRK